MPDRRPLSASQVDSALTDLPHWRARSGALHAAFTAATAADALALIAAIGALAEELDHHPDVDWRYRHVFARSTTHSIGNQISGLDVDLAARVSAAADRLGVTPETAAQQE